MNKNKKARVLLVQPLPSQSFMDNDEKILKKHFKIVKLNKLEEKYLTLKILKILLKKEVDLVFLWFAYYYYAPIVFLSKLFGKPSIVIAAGYDVANVPEINYGQFTASLRKRLSIKFVLKHADIILPVSDFTKNEVLEKVKPKQIKVVYNGVDTEKFKPLNEKREKIIVTIGRSSKDKIKLKGLDIFAKASIHFPEYKFVLIGSIEEAAKELKKINSSLIFTGIITHNEVINWLQKSKVYCQLSYRESFGLGNAEAMSCGCIPVVTNRGALAEIVGSNGYYVPYGDENATVEAIKKALDSSEEMEKSVRERILKMFSLTRREKSLLKIIKSLIAK